jgi:hypothetical protein
VHIDAGGAPPKAQLNDVCADIATQGPDGKMTGQCGIYASSLTVINPIATPTPAQLTTTQPVEVHDDNNRVIVVHLSDSEKKRLADAKGKMDDAKRDFDNARGAVELLHQIPHDWQDGSLVEENWDIDGFLVLTRKPNPTWAWMTPSTR